MVCCVPVRPEDITNGELGAEASIPLLYKITTNDRDGVLGYLKVGVSKE